ncbi:sensor histidine kinase [Polaromonas sp. SM01]|uniref:sensor histidine kinase n=1 Tax=Polaromonas sp. SM01 TaxID=3085630 RepID=UPI00298165EC|nr:ATP-binding protein [Polaromonas sp. SM01]MDW5441419.1 ATP-binding protein [Polaromonas sp. SM01]
MAHPTEPSSAGVTPSIAALLQQLREGGDRAAAQEILRITTELEEQLRQRSADVAAAHQALESFSYSVSHDLRAPLSTIDGFSRLLETSVTKGTTERSQHYLARIRFGVGQLNELITALLTVSRLLRAKLAPQTVDLSALAQAAFATLQATDVARTVRLDVQPDLVVHGDPALLGQLVKHLAGNAWKFSAKKDSADITLGSQPGPDGETVYFFRDNGAGFEMQQADKLFGIFQRLHTASEFPGLGVGLVSVQRIVGRHGGRVWVKAALEQGATVYFTLGPGPLPT